LVDCIVFNDSTPGGCADGSERRANNWGTRLSNKTVGLLVKGKTDGELPVSEEVLLPRGVLILKDVSRGGGLIWLLVLLVSLLVENVHHLLLCGTDCIPDINSFGRCLLLWGHGTLAELVLLLPDVINHGTMSILFVLLFLLVLLLPLLPLLLKIIGGISNLGTLRGYPRGLDDLGLDAVRRDRLHLDLLLVVKNVTFVEDILWGLGWRGLRRGRRGLGSPGGDLLGKERWVLALPLDHERLLLVGCLRRQRALRLA
jgi:hypothetical protein